MELLYIHGTSATAKKDGINEHTLKRKQNYALCNLVSRDQQTDRRTEVRAEREEERGTYTHGATVAAQLPSQLQHSRGHANGNKTR